jgi:hypothetical protein
LCRDGRIRTYDLHIPNVARYRATLHPELWYRSFFNPVVKWIELFVGMAGFEPTTSTSQMWRDTGLRYIPNFGIDLFLTLFLRVGKDIDFIGFFYSFTNFFLFQRRGRDSNPRYRYQYDSLANCSFRPLRHLSFQTSHFRPTGVVLRSANIVKQVIQQKKITKFVDNLSAHDRCSSALS